MAGVEDPFDSNIRCFAGHRPGTVMNYILRGLRGGTCTDLGFQSGRGLNGNKQAELRSVWIRKRSGCTYRPCRVFSVHAAWDSVVLVAE